MRSFWIVALAVLCSAAFGQQIPRAGTRFTFALPEGADAVLPIRTPSQITLNVLSAHDGTGVIWSPSGVTISFAFSAGQVKVMPLANTLMLIDDLGKSDRGLIVRTTQPVSLTLHYALDYAGEATQIWPDEALDTSYLIPGWGLWNDIQENNRTQITVVASENNTMVTVNPSINCIGGERAGVPSAMMLQRGECYVLKADTTTNGSLLTMLFRSRVTSDKPVSVLTSTTCAYVPLMSQACNPLLDHILPLQNTGTEFLVSPPSDIGQKGKVLFISDSGTFFVIGPGSTALASGGRAEMTLTQPTRFITTAPAQCYLLTGGNDFALFGDPTIVSVPPANRYFADTLMWFAPRIVNTYDGGTMLHFVSIIYPTADENRIFLDKDLVADYPVRTQISGTPMSAAMMQVREGLHSITSPAPVLATAYGLYAADAYSFVVMGKGDRIKIDTPQFDVRSSFGNPRTCEVFRGIVYLEEGLSASEGIYRIRLRINYDPAFADLISIEPSGMLAGLDVTIDTSVKGAIIVNVISEKTPIVGSGEMLAISFYGKQAGTSVVSTSMSASQLEFVHLETATDDYSDTLGIAQTRYTGQAAMSVIAESGEIGTKQPVLAHVFLDDTVSGLFSEARIRIAYDHNLLELAAVNDGIVEPNTKLLGWTHTKTTIDFETDEFIFKPANPAFLQGNGTLVRFRFTPYVTREDTTSVRAWAWLTSADPCPRDVVGIPASDLFEGVDICGAPSIRSALRSLPFQFLDVMPNPTTGEIEAFIRHSFKTGDELTCYLTDASGKRAWTTQATIASAPEARILLTLPNWIGSGTYILTLEAGGYAASRQIVVMR